MRQYSPLENYDRQDFNSRTPRGMRQQITLQITIDANFNSRTPRGMRQSVRVSTCVIAEFQLTHPTRDATRENPQRYGSQQISTHAPHAGCDPPSSWGRASVTDFNSRTPRGMRPVRHAVRAAGADFNSRTPRGMRHGRARRRSTIR